MPRAKRFFLPGYFWHITHRCHKREFLFKFSKDRQAWIRWLYEARRRYGLKILNYTVTSNHIHLLVKSEAGEIAEAMHLVAGSTAQQYNRRKARKGAFWDDRYHATAIESGRHLVNCMLYIDLNMVRAGVVNDPLEWPESGCCEIINPRPKYRTVLVDFVLESLKINTHSELVKQYREWQNDAMARMREDAPRWSESIAVGSEDFVFEIKKKLGINTERRDVYRANEMGTRELREDFELFEAKKGPE